MNSRLTPTPLLHAALLGALAAGWSTVTAQENIADRDVLLELLDEQTAIATKTRLNADYVPGIVTVLHGKELEARGARTVWEALGEVPGIALSIDASGRRQIVVRGLSDDYNSGNVKILLNDVSVNTFRDGLANPAMNLPIEQIDRIEVIRGPGSAVHGEYAYAGVVNIITRQEGQRLFAIAGSSNTRGAGLTHSWKPSGSDLRMGLNLAAWHTDGSVPDAGEDLLYNTTPSSAAYSYAPGPSNEALQAGAAIFNLDYRDFSLIVQLAEDGHGDHFGINQTLPPPESRIVLRNSSQSFKATQHLAPAPEWRLELSLGWRHAHQTRNNQYLSPPEDYGGTSADPDVILDSAYSEKEWRGEADLYWEGNERHRLWFGLSYSAIKVDESWSEFNLDPVTYAPTTTMYRWPIIPISGSERRIGSLMVQDEFRYSEGFTLTSGLRYDDYSDAGDSLAPRLAGVWRLNDRNIIKSQYARAFRPPNLVELQQSGGEIRPATIDTYEAGYLYKGELGQSRATLFRSDLSDLIVFDGAFNRYINADRASTHGIELEQEYRFNTRLALDASLSHAETRDERSGRPIAGAPRWLAQLGLNAHLTTETQLDFRYSYVGKRPRETLDTRAPLSSDLSANLTLSLTNVGANGINLRTGIKNLFNREIRYPSHLDTDVYGNAIVGYADDFPRPGRIWWLQLDYHY